MPDSGISWTVAHQAPLSMGFPRQEYWSGLPFPSPGDLPEPAISCFGREISLLQSHQGGRPFSSNSHVRCRILYVSVGYLFDFENTLKMIVLFLGS